MSDNRELDRLDNVRLASGSHRSWEQGACLMEAVAYVAGEGHSDRPVCASTVLGTFGRNLNDVLPDDLRQHLKPLVPLLIGTANDGHDEARGYLALDWLIRTYLPTWLRIGGLTGHADAVAALAPITNLAAAETARPVVRAAGAAAEAAAEAAVEAAVEAAAAPTARELQLSAIELFGRMITVGVANEATAAVLPPPVHAPTG